MHSVGSKEIDRHELGLAVWQWDSAVNEVEFILVFIIFHWAEIIINGFHF